MNTLSIVKIKDVSPHDDEITLFPTQDGFYTAYLRTNIKPIQVLYDNGTEQNETRTEYESDMYIINIPLKFDGEEQALSWIDENFDTLIAHQEALLYQHETITRGVESLRKLEKTDYKVIKAMESYLKSQGVIVRPEADEWRKDVRKSR